MAVGVLEPANYKCSPLVLACLMPKGTPTKVGKRGAKAPKDCDTFAPYSMGGSNSRTHNPLCVQIQNNNKIVLMQKNK